MGAGATGKRQWISTQQEDRHDANRREVINELDY